MPMEYFVETCRPGCEDKTMGCRYIDDVPLAIIIVDLCNGQVLRILTGCKKNGKSRAGHINQRPPNAGGL